MQIKNICFGSLFAVGNINKYTFFLRTFFFNLASVLLNVLRIELQMLFRCCLTLSWWRLLSYRNQSIDLLGKSTDWFLYDNGLRHERDNTHNHHQTEPPFAFAIFLFLSRAWLFMSHYDLFFIFTSTFIMTNCLISWKQTNLFFCLFFGILEFRIFSIFRIIFRW